MRVAVDVRDLHIAKTGNKTYLEELCRVLPEVNDEHQFLFLAPRWTIPAGKTAWKKILGHLAFYYWKEIELPWRAWRKKCDLVFCTDYVVPLFFPGDTMPVFHDAGFWERPQDYNRYWRSLLDLLALPAARRSEATLTVSEFSKGRLASLTGIPYENIEVVYEAPKSAVRSQQNLCLVKSVLEKHNLIDTPFLLHVGVLEKRKNLPRLVEAFALATRDLPPGIKLVLVGQAGPKQDMDDTHAIEKMIRKYGLEKSVMLTDYVSDDELLAFYQGATCYVFPSLYEGFGLPILEAFANDLPIVAADQTSIPEIAGDAALLFNPNNTEEMARQIARAVNEDALRQMLIQAGRRRLLDFSWEKTALEIVQIMERVVENRQKDHDN